MKLHVNLQFCYMNKVPMKVVENQERNTGKKIYLIFFYVYNWQIFGKLPNFWHIFLAKKLKKKVFYNS